MSGLLSGLWKPNTKGLYTGPLDGLNAFNVSAPSTPTPIAVWDWTPTTYAGVDPAGTATYHWDMQDTSGDLTESIVGGGTHDAAQVSASAESVIGQTAPGFSDGSDLSGRKCLEGISAPGSARYRVGTGILDSSSDSVAFRVVFRAIDPGAKKAVLCARHDGTRGYFVRLNDGTAAAQIWVQDGTNSANVSLSSNGYLDGAWHCIEAIIDWTAGTVRIRTDLNTSGASSSLASLAQGSTNSTEDFAIGGRTTNGLGNCQITDLYAWEGSAAESIDSTAWSEVWPYFAEPAGLPDYLQGHLSTYVGVHPVPCDRMDGDGDGLWYLASGGASQYPVGYASALESRGAPNGFMLWTGNDTNNDLPESEHYEGSGWAATNVTVSAAAADLADNKLGFRAARKLTASADNGYIESVFQSASTGGLQAWCWIAGSGGTVTGRLIAHDGSSETASQAFSADDGVWTLVRLNFTGSGTDKLRIEIDTNGEAIHVCHVGFRGDTFDADTVPIPTYGVGVTTDDVNIAGAPVVSGDWPESAGSMEIFLMENSPTDRVSNSPFMDWQPSAGLGNRLIVENSGAFDDVQVRWWDDSATLIVNGTELAGTDSEFEKGCCWRLEWDDSNDLGSSEYIRSRIIDASGNDDQTLRASSWTSGDDITKVSLGIQGTIASTTGTKGIGYCRIWDQTGVLTLA